MTTQLVQIRCNSLRSKSSYGAFGDFDEEMAELTGSTTTYWCLKTMGKAGPDDHFVHRGACREGARLLGSLRLKYFHSSSHKIVILSEAKDLRLHLFWLRAE